MKKFEKENGIIVKGVEFNPIPGQKNLYASRCGRIYSTYKNEFVVTWKNNSGYLLFNCYNNETKKSSTRLLSRAILLTWGDLPEDFDTVKYQCNHIDENKLNNDISNLEWLTQINNINYGTRSIREGISLKGNQNACGRRTKDTPINRYVYICDGKEFDVNELAEYIGCSKSCITEAFRRGKNYCKEHEISRIVLPRKDIKTKVVREYRLYSESGELLYSASTITEICKLADIKSSSYVYESNKNDTYFYPNINSNTAMRAEITKQWIEC